MAEKKEAAKKSELEKEGAEARENAEEELERRAAENPANEQKAALAGSERERVSRLADDQADEPRYSGRKQDPGEVFTALHAMVRNGKSVHPGETVKFDEDEGEHVADLLAAGVIVRGKGKDAERALAQADLARAEAVGPVSNW